MSGGIRVLRRASPDLYPVKDVWLRQSDLTSKDHHRIAELVYYRFLGG